MYGIDHGILSAGKKGGSGKEEMKRFSTAGEAIAWLDSCHYETKQQAVIRERELLKLLGDPQKKLKFVHVGGTNGKGSTCAMTESILRKAGFKTGLFPSPYIEKFNERIQVNCEPIADQDLARIAWTVALAAKKMPDPPRHFELITAIGMLYFLEQGCDLVVLEVGMGGEFDSTNAIDAPEVAVFTNIGLDHTQFLGSTVEEIARTKSGIIKPGSAVVLYDGRPSVTKILEEKAGLCKNPIYRAAEVEVRLLSADLEGQSFTANGKKYCLGLLGAHQLQNARTVLKIVEALRNKGWKIPEEAVVKGLAEARWPARFEVLSNDPVFVLDGGHNPQCAQAIAEAVRQYFPEQRITLLIGMLADKDWSSAVEELLPLVKEAITATPDSLRAMQAEKLAEELLERGCPARPAATVKEAISMALETGRPVVAFGSLYLAGEIRSIFKEMEKTAVCRNL